VEVLEVGLSTAMVVAERMAVGRFTPTRASDALMGLREHHLLAPGAGAITLIAWAGALGVLGIALSARQDID
jgi:hypothetical protein